MTAKTIKPNHMIRLEEKFVKNADFTGEHTFTLVKRTDDVAMYARHKEDGSLFGYEVFLVKIVLEGAKLPNGTLVEESYEKYATKNTIGPSGYFCSNLLSANKRYDQLLLKVAKAA
jgi:hypothetical protein